jgi:hypothetical protein
MCFESGGICGKMTCTCIFLMSNKKKLKKEVSFIFDSPLTTINTELNDSKMGCR